MGAKVTTIFLYSSFSTGYRKHSDSPGWGTPQAAMWMSICSTSCSGTCSTMEPSMCSTEIPLVPGAPPIPFPSPHCSQCCFSPLCLSSIFSLSKTCFHSRSWAQLLCSTSTWCGSVVELAEPRTGKPQYLLTHDTMQPSPTTKTLPCKVQKSGLSGLEVSELRTFWLQRWLPDTRGEQEAFFNEELLWQNLFSVLS